MKWQQGRIVLATAGRDAGQYFAVVTPITEESEERFVWLADGKRRPLAKPKRKNQKHVQPIDAVVPPDCLSDRRLRKWLNQFAAAHK